MKTIEERRAYQRGYQCASTRWPMHKPPTPPEPIIARMMTVLKEVRDICDGFRATLDEDDLFGQELELAISKADDALISVSVWLRQSNETKKVES